MKRSIYIIIVGLVICGGLIGVIKWLGQEQVPLEVGVQPSSSKPAVLTEPSKDIDNIPPASSISTNDAVARAKKPIKLSQNSEFMVSGGSATSVIRFIEGSIKPLDVHVGDTQNFRIVVSSPNGIKRVVAEIETDKGINEVELTREGLISILDTYPNPYTVNPQDNSLQILTDQELAKARKEEYQQELARKNGDKVSAAQGEKEVWTGSWVVKDTHNENYLTTFVAYDSAGNVEKMSMIWSDLCLIPLGGSWSTETTTQGCVVPADTVDGVDNGDVSIVSGKNLNLSAGNIDFIWNPGYSVYFDGGALILAADNSSHLKQSYLYAQDVDQDFHALPTALDQQSFYDDSNLRGGDRRRYVLIGADDCNDQNEYAVPGTAIYYTATFTNYIDPALVYDWDCDGTVELNPATDETCNASPGRLGTGYIYRTCEGFDVGGCCDITQSRPKDLLARDYDWHFIHPVRAGAAGCCEGLPSNLDGCTSTVALSTSSCGTTQNVAWRASYYTTSGCKDNPIEYYRQTSAQVSCH